MRTAQVSNSNKLFLNATHTHQGPQQITRRGFL